MKACGNDCMECLLHSLGGAVKRVGLLQRAVQRPSCGCWRRLARLLQDGCCSAGPLQLCTATWSGGPSRGVRFGEASHRGPKNANQAANLLSMFDSSLRGTIRKMMEQLVKQAVQQALEQAGIGSETSVANSRPTSVSPRAWRRKMQG